MIIFFKNAVEIAGIIISGQSDDILYRKGGSGKQESGLIQSFCLQKVFEGMAGIFFDNFAEGIGRHMEVLGNLRQLRRAVIGFNIF